MLINLSNHPLSKWSDKQKRSAAQQFGEIIDLPFPVIPTDADLDQVIQLVEEHVEKCMQIFSERKQLSSQQNSNKNAIHIMGEMTFVYQFVNKMSEHGILCFASTLKEESKEFVQFRSYTNELF